MITVADLLQTRAWERCGRHAGGGLLQKGGPEDPRQALSLLGGEWRELRGESGASGLDLVDVRQMVMLAYRRPVSVRYTTAAKEREWRLYATRKCAFHS